MAPIHSEVSGIFNNKGMWRQSFKSKLSTTEDEVLGASTKLGKAKKLAKMKRQW